MSHVQLLIYFMLLNGSNHSVLFCESVLDSHGLEWRGIHAPRQSPETVESPENTQTGMIISPP